MQTKKNDLNKVKQNNVYDLIKDFYDADEDWNIYLSQKYAEGFIRSKAFSGTPEDELCHIWNNIVMLCIYISNVDIYLGDLSADDMVDGVAWCGRNVSDFHLTSEKVAFFLDVCEDLIKYLQSKNVIFNDSEVALAKAKLLKDGKLQMLNPDGTFKPGFEQYALNANPDLSVKIFVNLNTNLNDLVEDMRAYFSQEQFAADRKRASFLYYGILTDFKKDDQKMEAEEEQYFWDYFFFDYRMLANDETPLYSYRDYYQKSHAEPKGQVKSCVDLLTTLLKARIILFSIEDFDARTGLYRCRDFLSKEYFDINVPTDFNFEVEDIIFLGHMLPDGSMVTNYLRCLKMGATAQSRIWEMLSHLKEWYMVQCPEAVDWKVFVSQNSILIIHLALLYSGFYMMGSFNRETKVKDYYPMPLVEDSPVILAASQLIKNFGFSYRAQKLLQRLWSDFCASGENISEAEIGTWAVALVYVFVNLNKTYKFSITEYGKKAHISEDEVLEKAKIIEMVLEIEPFDPRYIDEEGMLMLALS